MAQRLVTERRYKVRVWSPEGPPGGYWTPTIEAQSAVEAVVLAKLQLKGAPELRHMVGWELYAVPEDWWLAGPLGQAAGEGTR